MKKRSAKTILHELTKQAMMGSVIESMRPKVGKYVLRLPPEDREILQTLKSDDIKNDGVPEWGK